MTTGREMEKREASHWQQRFNSEQKVECLYASEFRPDPSGIRDELKVTSLVYHRFGAPHRFSPLEWGGLTGKPMRVIL